MNEIIKMKIKMLEISRRILGEKYLNTILAVNNFVNIFKKQSQLDEAAKIKTNIMKKIRRIIE